MSSATLQPERAPAAAPRAQPQAPKPRQQPPWNVVLLDDDDHTYEYVIRMMQTLFGHSRETAFKIASEVDTTGRAICATLHKELAELKQLQVHAFGIDPLSARCAGSMTATIEPALGGNDDADGAGPGGGDRP